MKKNGGRKSCDTLPTRKSSWKCWFYEVEETHYYTVLQTMYCFTLFSRKLTILMNFLKYISKAEVRRRFFLYFILSTQYNFINLFSDSMKGWDLILNSENTFKTSGQVRSLGGNNVWAMCKNSTLKRIGCVINWKNTVGVHKYCTVQCTLYVYSMYVLHKYALHT